jgi:Phosphodiester glycosidase
MGAILRLSRHRVLLVAAVFFLAAVGALATLYTYTGLYGLNLVLWRGVAFWVAVTPDDSRLSASMRLALREPQTVGTAGSFTWQQIEPGFEVGELPVIVGGSEVDRILLARIDPARFRFVIRNRAAGDKDASAWLDELGAVLVINASYFRHDGTPEAPFLSDGTLLGPRAYEARHGAFVSSAHLTDIRDLANDEWPAAFRGARDAIVSYPLLVAADGSNRVKADDRWLANRSFVGVDGSGHVILGTTANAFFSLNRLAAFLRAAPLGLVKALNLDGGPVACQAISLDTYRRAFCGQWELAVHDGELKLLWWAFGPQLWALPNVMAVLRK